MKEKTKTSKISKTPPTSRKATVGVVISDKMQKTVVVGVEYSKIHPGYGKRLKRMHKLYAHNDLEAKTGDRVVVKEVRPLSKLKRWKVVEVKI